MGMCSRCGQPSDELHNVHKMYEDYVFKFSLMRTVYKSLNSSSDWSEAQFDPEFLDATSTESIFNTSGVRKPTDQGVKEREPLGEVPSNVEKPTEDQRTGKRGLKIRHISLNTNVAPVKSSSVGSIFLRRTS